jgi:ABC-type lipoprotein export system ATPase subunit
VLDTDIATLDRRASAEFRGRHIGFIFQDFNLIPELRFDKVMTQALAFNVRAEHALARWS